MTIRKESKMTTDKHIEPKWNSARQLHLPDGRWVIIKDMAGYTPVWTPESYGASYILWPAVKTLCEAKAIAEAVGTPDPLCESCNGLGRVGYGASDKCIDCPDCEDIHASRRNL